MDREIVHQLGVPLVEGSTASEADDFDSCGDPGGRDYVVQWTSPITGRIVASTEGSDFDTVLSVLFGCESSAARECNDDHGDSRFSRLVLDVRSSDQLLFVVDGFDSTDYGDFELSITECVPDCSGRECGPDPVCGSSCGSCNDFNACTTDECNGGVCEFFPAPNGAISCSGDTVERCSGGIPVTWNCLDACENLGLNIFLGCDPATDDCVCGSFPESCLATDRVCATWHGTLGLATCAAGEGLWRFRSCDEVCIDAGYTRATGKCEPGAGGLDVCICCTSACAGKVCGSDGCGGSCGYCTGGNVCRGGGTYCGPDPCSECLKACRGLPSCCTGVGCICDSAC